MQRQLQPAAIAAAMLSVFSAHAADVPAAADIVVTATRFPDTAQKASSNITVISAEDIRNSPAINLPDVLKTVAGIDVRPLYGSMGIDSTIGMRGFGDTAQNNMLILVDGQRLNPIDLGSISWSAIPLNSISRIEVIPGGGTVLYGDQATGGVINIITDKSTNAAPSVMATAGSYGYKAADANAAGGNEQGYLNIAAHYAETDGWRQNSEADQAALSGRGGLHLSGGETFLDYAVYHDKSGLPGSLLSSAYRNDPDSARTPSDSQNRDGYRLRPGVSYALSSTLKLEGEISVAHEKYEGDNVSFSSIYDRDRDTWSLTPRLRWQHGLGQLASETVTGIDYYDGTVKAHLDGASFITTENQDATQKSTALYAQNTTELNGNWILNSGVRSQRMDQDASQGAYVADFGFGPFTTPGFSGNAVHTRTAYDLGLVYRDDGWRAYGKVGTTFRFPTTDELFAFDPFTGNPVFSGDLKPQHGNLGEIGASFDKGPAKGKVTLYRIDLSDEIGFDGNTFANVNLPDTRREGLESELAWNITSGLVAQVSYAYTDATFSAGPNTDKEIPLVSRNKASTQLTWYQGSVGTYSAVLSYVGNRRYSGDFANVRGELSGYTTMDLQASWNLNPWTITAKLLNAFDQRYAPFAGYSTFVNDHFFFPADARSLFVSARYQFK